MPCFFSSLLTILIQRYFTLIEYFFIFEFFNILKINQVIIEKTVTFVFKLNLQSTKLHITPCTCEISVSSTWAQFSVL